MESENKKDARRYTIHVQEVTKSFRGQAVLKNISLNCESGHIYGIVGYNGSGKTVLFKCICGFYKVDKGYITVNGRIMGKNLDMLHDAGIIIEDPGYIRNMSGYQNLEYLWRITHKKDKEHIVETMQNVGLDPKTKKRVGQYSLGMRQRLAIAQATMEDQSILILDEPMNGLDKKGVSDMRDFFMEQKRKGKLILMASHNREDIDVLCDEVYEMDGGVLTKIR